MFSYMYVWKCAHAYECTHISVHMCSHLLTAFLSLCFANEHNLSFQIHERLQHYDATKHPRSVYFIFVVISPFVLKQKKSL